MTAVEDKLKLFAKIIFENIEKESQEKIQKLARDQESTLETEKKKILQQSQDLIKQTQRKAEKKREQILSKANTDRQHTLLEKQKAIFDTTIEDIKQLAKNYTARQEYINYIESCIKNGFPGMDNKNIMLFFHPNDINRYKDEIQDLVQKYKKQDSEISINLGKEEIIGGCILEDAQKTFRIDCSLATLIDNNKALIGKMLMENLQ